MKLALSIVACFVFLTLGGCIDDAPAYKQNVLAADAGAEGSWMVQLPPSDGEPVGKEMPLTIAARKAKVTGGRLGQHNEHKKGDEGTVAAYTITLTLPPEERKPEDESDAKSEEGIRELTYDAVLLSIEGATFLAYEPSSKRHPELTHMDFIPIHRVLRFERKDDVISVWPMKRAVVWMPEIKALDESDAEPELPAEEGQYLVSDPDRLVRVLGKALKQPDAWHEPITVKRVK